MILQNVITTLYVGSFRFWYLFFNIGLSPIQVYNEITQNFEVFLVAAGAVASTWGCYSSLSSLRWHPLLKFKPWHHFPPLKLTPKRVQIPKSSSSRRSKWRRPLRLNSKQTTRFTFGKTPKVFLLFDCKWLQLSQTACSSIVEHGGWIEGFVTISSQNF